MEIVFPLITVGGMRHNPGTFTSFGYCAHGEGAFCQKVKIAPLVTCFAALFALPVAVANYAHGVNGIVSSVHPLATQAGINVLKDGGNAIDAAFAVALMAGVVDGHDSGIGGGCFILIRRANGEIFALDGRESAPAAAKRDMFIRNGRADTNLSQNGALAVAIPGMLATFETARRKFGTKPLAELIEPSAQIAEKGFPIDFMFARALRRTEKALKTFEEAQRILFRPDGSPLVEGDVLKQPDLAKSYRAIASRGIDWFYKGEYAEAIDAWMKKNGGIITAADFAEYQVKERKPLQTTYRDYTIVGFPPPSSGCVHIAQILNIIEGFPIASLSPVDRYHVLAEAMKFAFADRSHWLGDPGFVRVPIGIVDKAYARGITAQIKMDRAADVPSHGVPPESDKRFFEQHTTHFCVVDSAGNWVSCTQTINTSFGSKVVIPGTGILLNNEMDSFSIEPGVPNAYGMVGGDANAIEPRKRSVSSQCPTLILKDGNPILATGGAGGPTIISQTVQNIVNVIDLGLRLDEALAKPRIHHQWQPNEIRVEKDVPQEIRQGLAQRGHKISEETIISVSHMAGRAPNGKTLVGASDPRAGGMALGF